MVTKFKILRFNPETDPAPQYKTYDLEIPKGATLLDCINLIKWTMDGTLSYRMSCRSAICGSCAMSINGHARLTCKTQAISQVTPQNEIVIEPLKNFKIIKDLVVDLEPLFEKLNRIEPFLDPLFSPDPQKENLQSPHDQEKIDAASTCILCACCYSDCCINAIDEEFLGPATLAKAQRFIEDSRDAKTGERIRKISAAHGIWDCTHCLECSERCPTEAKPVERIADLRRAAIAKGETDNNGARHTLAFSKLVEHSGRLDENKIPVMSMGYTNIKGLLELMPIGIRMFLKGKNPPLIHKPIDEVEDVRRICKLIKEKK